MTPKQEERQGKNNKRRNRGKEKEESDTRGDVGDDSNRRFNPFSSNRRIRPNDNALAQTNTTHLPKRNTC